jgi:hypothetical protein
MLHITLTLELDEARAALVAFDTLRSNPHVLDAGIRLHVLALLCGPADKIDALIGDQSD